jgi:hypothetical protein
VELHEAACAAVTTLPDAPVIVPVHITHVRPRGGQRERDPEAERALAEHLIATISRHRQAGRAALVAGDLDTAYDELCAARLLEPDLDRLGAGALARIPSDWEIETDLTPLARVLSAHQHPRAADAWRRILDDRPARSIHAEAAEWLARDAMRRGESRSALRALHAASELGRGVSPEMFHAVYRQAGLDPKAMFKLYLCAVHLDNGSARALGLRDPLTRLVWADQDARWWLGQPSAANRGRASDQRTEALARARDLAVGKRDIGWLLLAEGDYAAGPRGVRTLGRTLRAGRADLTDEDAFVRIRLCYEGAAERLPDVAWPHYRLAELLAWAGFAQQAAEHLAQAERRSLGGPTSERTHRAALRALVDSGLGRGVDGMPTLVRPFPTELFTPSLRWRLGLR